MPLGRPCQRHPQQLATHGWCCRAASWRSDLLDHGLRVGRGRPRWRSTRASGRAARRPGASPGSPPRRAVAGRRPPRRQRPGTATTSARPASTGARAGQAHRAGAARRGVAQAAGSGAAGAGHLAGQARRPARPRRWAGVAGARPRRRGGRAGARRDTPAVPRTLARPGGRSAGHSAAPRRQPGTWPGPPPRGPAAAHRADLRSAAARRAPRRVRAVRWPPSAAARSRKDLYRNLFDRISVRSYSRSIERRYGTVSIARVRQFAGRSNRCLRSATATASVGIEGQ